MVVFLKASAFVLESDHASALDPVRTNDRMGTLLDIASYRPSEAEPALASLFDMKADIKRIKAFARKWDPKVR